MTIRNLLLSICFITACSTSNQSQELSRAEAIEDLRQLRTEFEKYHAGYTRYSTRGSLDQYFNQAEKRLEDMSIVDLYKEVTFLANKIRCGHTRASLPMGARQSFIDSHVFLPVSVVILGDQVFITNSLNSKIEAGSEVTAINGLPIAKILTEIYSHHSADGFIQSSKRQLTSRYFYYYFQLYLGGNKTNYQVETPKGSVTIEGVRWEEIETIQKSSNGNATMELVHQKSHSYLRIGSFGESSLRNNGFDFESFLMKSFKELKDLGVETLILDLRGNGGGKDSFGARLVSYFLNEPFGYFDRIEVTQSYGGYGQIEEQNGRRLMMSHTGLEQQRIPRNSFLGKVFLLTDGWTFSTAADVVSVLNYKKRVTILGEETGGGKYGNTSGASKSITLSNSRIRVNVPMWKYTTALGNEQDTGTGIIPDYPITPTMEQVLKDEDAVMSQCLKMIEKG